MRYRLHGFLDEAVEETRRVVASDPNRFRPQFAGTSFINISSLLKYGTLNSIQ
jgi:hypothetical protein